MRNLCQSAYMTPPPKPRRISVEVEEALPGAAHQRLEGGWSLESPFRARVTDSAVPVSIVLDVEAAGGRLVARAVRVERRKPSGVVDGSTLRALPIEQYLSHALNAATRFNPAVGIPLVRPEVDRTDTTVTTSLMGTRRQIEQLAEGQARRRPGREAMERVVAAYKEALADPRTHHRPTAAVAEKLHFSHGHVSRLLTQARKEQLLGRARPGRAGEVVKDRRKTR